LRRSEMFFFLLFMLSLNAMEEQKNIFLKKEEISQERLRARWHGLEKGLLKKIAENQHAEGIIKVFKEKKLIASYDLKTKEVTTYFPEGQLIFSYKEFKKNLKNNDDEFTIGTSRGEDYLPIENGERPGQRKSDEAKLSLYFKLADEIGKARPQEVITVEGAAHEHLQESVDLVLLKKRKRCYCFLM